MGRSIKILASTSFPGRPAGLVVAPDGSMVMSDDKPGLVYRIRYEGE